MSIATFQYFEKNGTYCTQRTGPLPKGRVWTRADILAFNNGVMPGLSHDGAQYIVLIDPGENRAPQLLLPEVTP